MVRLIGCLRDRVGLLKGLFFLWLAFTVLFDFMAHRHEPHFFGDAVIGFWAGFGLLGCLAMGVVCKGIYHLWLMQDEDYYDR